MTAPSRRRTFVSFAILASVAAALAHSAPFTPGNVVVYRVGNGAPIVTAGNALFLDEYTPAGALVQSLAMPTAASGANKALIASGNGVTDGLLTRSADGSCLVVPGYGRDLGPTSSLTAANGVTRVVGRVTAAGEIDTTTALGDSASGALLRSAATSDCVALWTSMSIGGVRATTLGSTTSTDLTNAVQPDTRAVAIYGGQLYVSWMNGTTNSKGIGAVGTGLPVSGAQAVTRVAGLTDASFPNTYQFFFADLSPAVPGLDTLYMADGGSGVLTKFSLVGGSWVSNGTVGASADAYRGLTGVVSGTIVTLYAVRKATATGGGELVKLTDASGYNGAFAGAPTLLATASTNTAFRGVAPAPAITITPSAGANGSIAPSTPQVVAPGAISTFTVTANPGYTAIVNGCGGTLSGTSFTTAPASATCAVTATFTQIPTFVVTPSAGPNGSIAPNTPRTLLLGTSTSFTITPDPGYGFAVGGTCGGTLSGNTFTVNPVASDCSVVATFTSITRIVLPSAGANGTITPDTAQVIGLGASAAFQVVPGAGYSASVGGTCGGTLSGTTYTTNAVTADCTVAASFAPLPAYTVTPLVSGHGSATPNAPQSVVQGEAASFTLVPAPGYSMAIRGTCGGSLVGATYTTGPVTQDCSVVVSFAAKLVLFVGNSYTFGRVDPVMSYNAAGVTDLTNDMWLANPIGTNADEPHPWGGIPGVFKKLTDQAGLDYDVSISARNAASLRGHYLNSSPAGWDLRGNIASQKWDTVVLQDLSDEPLPANRGVNADLPYFNAYVDKIEAWIHHGAAESYTETQLYGNGSDATCSAITGASLNVCNRANVIAPANLNARTGTDVILYQTWARPDMIAPNGTNASGTFYTAAEGLEAMTADFHNAYFGRAAANANIAGVSPVGDAFLRAVTDGVAMRDPYVPEAGKINLWHTDFFHPSKYGSYLSALVHFATIAGIDPMTLGPGEQAAADLGIAPAVAVQLQRVAREVVMPDTAAPASVATPSPSANANGWNSGSVTVTFNATDNGGWGVAGVSYTLAGAQAGAGTVPSGGTLSISAQGVTTVTYFATDIAGNAESPHSLVIRIDSTAPTLSVPANISVDATSAAGATVSYSVIGVDDSGIAPSISCAPAAGTTFAIGTTTVSCTATDAADNSATTTFTIAVAARIVTPSAGSNGSITPATPQAVVPGQVASFTVAAAPGYIASVGGSCGGSLVANTFTTAPVAVDCTVSAAFAPITFTVTPSAGAHGTITPATAQAVVTGQATTFTITPAPGYSAAVRGTCGGTFSGASFTTAAVTHDCTLVVAFATKLVLFVGNSYTFGRVDPVLSYNTANVTDLTHEMWLANPVGTNADEPHPWGGIPGVFKKLTDQASLDYDVSISARNAASLRGHYLNSNPADWDLRGNIGSQRWDVVVLQDLSDEPLPAGRGPNANLPYFNAYVDKIEAWIHGGAAETFTETQLFGGGSAATCSTLTGASVSACNTARVIAPANTNARAGAEVVLYQTWARPDMIAPHGTNDAGTFYTAAEGLEAMTADFHNAYFGRAAANANIADVSPVGDAFLRAVTDGVAMRDPYVPEAGKINLWHTDFFHPSKYGSYLSALVHFATITGINPMTLGSGEQAAADLGIAPAIAAQLQRVARETVMPDAVAPMSAAAVSVPPNANGWNAGAVTVTFAATDNAGGWGVAQVSYTLAGIQGGTGSVSPGGSVTISAQGTTTITYFATDVAGNSEPARTLVIRIDSTPPTISVPANITVDAGSPAGAAVTYTIAGADNSGIAPGVSCAPISGSTFAIGTRTVTCTATDLAGNTSSATFAVTVRGAAEQTAKLISDVLALRGINVSPTVTALLTSYLQGALSSGNTNVFCAAVTLFTKEVTARSGKSIPAATAAQLAASANRIRAVVGCH